MAKRLNKVLQNINEKSKKLSISQPALEENPRQKSYENQKRYGEKNRDSLSKYPEVRSQERNTQSPYDKERILKDY